MKNLFLTIVMLLVVMITGCQSFNDLIGFGSGDDETPIEINDAVDEVDIVVDKDVPGEWSESGEVVKSRDIWEPIPGVTLPAIYFSYDKDLLGTSEKRKLDQIGIYLKKNSQIGLIIEGNCDERGGIEYNRSLGEKRALTVKDYLISTGISADRIQTISYGEEKPVATGKGETIYSKNRRAELIAVKIK